MKSILKITAFSIIFLTFQAFTNEKSNNLIISSPDKDSSGCDLAVAGFDSKEQFLTFFEELKKAAATKDKKALSRLIHYPLQTFAKKYPKSIKNKEIFMRDFDKVMPAKLLNIIQNQKVENLFCRDHGVMFGNGEIWISVHNKQVFVTTLNSN